MTLKIIRYCPDDAARRTGAEEGKFLQVIVNGQEFLLCAASARHRYHNQILAHFLTEQGIAHHWAGPEKREVDSNAVNTVGGGRYRADHERGLLTLWDDSHAYGRFDETELAAKIAAAQHPWSRYQVRIH